MSPLARAQRRTRRRAAGFTLVELMVAMVAGLIVAMAVVGISRDATNTFHEETRVASAETNLRTAIDRIRLDVQRAAFMATGNIQRDRAVPLLPTDPKPTPVGKLGNLSSIVLTQDSNATLTPQSLRNDPLRPERLELFGNYTTADLFAASQIQSGASSCGGPRVVLATNTAAMYRVFASTAPDDALKRMFQPIDATEFFVRLTDHDQGVGGHGRSIYVKGCRERTAGVLAGTNTPYVDLDPTTGGNILTKDFAYNFSVNPVIGVRWEIRALDAGQSSDNGYAALMTSDGGTGGPKYDLLRSYLDANGDPAGSPEVVAENAVDLAFAFSVDRGNYGDDLTNPTPNLVSYGFGDPLNATIAPADLQAADAFPQRIRSVRIRLSTRAALPDRPSSMMLPPPPATNGYPVRYCANPDGCTEDGTRTDWARMRTVTTEVALPNQAGFTW